MRILLLADIHGNMPALQAIDSHFSTTPFDAIINCGDSIVYAPFPNQVLQWLQAKHAISILGNTDKKVIKLLKGKDFAKPAKFEKRVMYTHTAHQLTADNARVLTAMPKWSTLSLSSERNVEETRNSIDTLGIFHGSPAKHHEFLFDTTPVQYFRHLADQYPYKVIVTGHSHTPYHKVIGNSHFINPGSAGRMFDGNPAASCAVLECNNHEITVDHFRIDYDINQVIDELERQGLPRIYQEMYRLGKKLN